MYICIYIYTYIYIHIYVHLFILYSGGFSLRLSHISSGYPLVHQQFASNMAMKIVSFPVKDGDFP